MIRFYYQGVSDNLVDFLRHIRMFLQISLGRFPALLMRFPL